MRLRTWLSRWASMSRAERRFLVGAWLWLPIVWARLRIGGLTSLQRSLAHDQPRSSSRHIESTCANRSAELVKLAARFAPAPSTCLTRSLVLLLMLRRRGIEAQLKIGVRLTTGRLEAHAWVESNGMPINDRPDIGSDFLPFADPLPAHAFLGR